MSIYPSVTKEVIWLVINLVILSEQQKKRKNISNKEQVSKQIHDQVLAESFKIVTKKSAEVNKSTKEIEEIFKKKQIRKL